MRAGIWDFCNVNKVTSLLGLNVRRNRPDDVHLLRNYTTTAKLALKSKIIPTSLGSFQKDLSCSKVTQQQLQKYSRYSASTIMASHSKDLYLNDYDIIGFDLDGTLLRYDLDEMTVLVYEVLKQYLVEQKGHSRALLDLPLDFDFLQKGLVLDGPKGNVLKLSHEAVILRATHGTRLLSDEEIVAAYGKQRQWNVTTAFYKDPLSTWNGPAAEQMRALLDYFDMPGALVFAQAVDVIDKEAGEPPVEYSVWSDLLAGLMHNYSRDNFYNGKSAYFNAMRAEPERYVLRTNAQVINWLQQLRGAGKKLFLLTGSNIDFANLTATQAFGQEWQHMFDFVVTYAKKPGFFTMQRPFMAVDVPGLREVPNSEVSVEAALQPGEIYSQGNWHQLHEALARMLNKDTSEARALYFGDNVIQDVYTPVKHRDFDAVAIAEELLLLDDCGNNNNNNDYPYREALGSQFWDSYFSVNCTPTLWSSFIVNFAQLCAPSMELIAQCPPTKRIVSKNANGFYPALPKELEATNITSWGQSQGGV